jgi:hypothetical protein
MGMKFVIIMILFLNISILYARGVSAGTVIKNSASLSFSIEDEKFKIKSNVNKSVVAQLVDVKVSWMDIRAITVSAGEKKKVLSFKVLNSGNGKDKYRLFADTVDYKSDFRVEKKVIYLDFNHNYRFDSEDRVRKTYELDADQAQMFFVVSTIKEDAKVESGSDSYINFRAVSYIGGSGIAGRIHKRAGVNKVDAVDGFSGGISEDEGAYKLLLANVVLAKNVTEDAQGIITVSIDVHIEGEGIARRVKIVDAIPDETIYIKNSLTLDGMSLSDQEDGDQGRYKRKYKSRKAQILMSLGDLDVSSHHTITYNLKIR